MIPALRLPAVLQYSNGGHIPKASNMLHQFRCSTPTKTPYKAANSAGLKTMTKAIRMPARIDIFRHLVHFVPVSGVSDLR
ncbi:hypothetical protein CAter282_0178 [Collimonas arenae]|uniref:Uncharacterized protein n=1 Tax=Collimonas arenae TaxID=279058 RepID=A0A127QEF9_9BURK|nr:hypothetical protein CAter282_0178 [Collimonas arenae]